MVSSKSTVKILQLQFVEQQMVAEMVGPQMVE